MSSSGSILKLSSGLTTRGLTVKTCGLADCVILGDYQIAIRDLLLATSFVLTNEPFEKSDDCRPQFVEHIKSMEVKPYGKRFDLNENEWPLQCLRAKNPQPQF